MRCCPSGALVVLCGGIGGLGFGLGFGDALEIVERVLWVDGLGGFFYRFDLARGGVEREECVGRRLAYFHRFTN